MTLLKAMMLVMSLLLNQFFCDIPEVQLVVEVWRLVEELGDVWLEVLVQYII